MASAVIFAITAVAQTTLTDEVNTGQAKVTQGDAVEGEKSLIFSTSLSRP